MTPRLDKPPLLLAAMACIASLAVAGSGELSSAIAGSTGGCTPGSDWGTARASLAPEVTSLVNADRSALGLTQLQVSRTLTASAVWKARHMAKYEYFGHDDPAPPLARSAFQRISACGYTGDNVGENIAEGFRTPATVMQAWLLSPGHRANIENPSFRVIGVGVAQSASGALFWVQDFGSSADQSAVNLAPVAHADRRTVWAGYTTPIRVLRNDRDPDGDTLSVAQITVVPRHGWAKIAGSGSEITYRPYPGFFGRDRFRYEVTDGRGAYSSAPVILRVRR